MSKDNICGETNTNQKISQLWCKGKDVPSHGDDRKGLLRSKVQEYISYSRQNSSSLSQIEALFKLLDLATSISAEDMSFLRRTLWTVNEITLTDCKRETLPSSFGSVFSNLKILNLANNRFDSFPESILRCLTLEEVNLGRNNIVRLDDRIGELVNLKQLDVSENKLMYLPMSLSALVALTHLRINGNELRTLYLNPGSQKREHLLQQNRERNKVQSKMDWEEVICPFKLSAVFYNKKTGQATNTQPRFSATMQYGENRNEPSFPDGFEWEIVCNQDTIAHYYNHLTSDTATEAPECLDRIGNLLRLRILDVGDNNLKSLPQSIARMSHLEVIEAPRNNLVDVELIIKCKLLRRINLKKNYLRSAPSDLARTLEHFDLSHNCLETFPPPILELKRLQYLNLNYNGIKVVPCELGFLTKLNELDLRNNPIDDPPYDEMIKNTDEVLWRCRQTYKVRQKQGDQKMIDHSSGICLRRSALSPDFQNRLLEMINEAASSDQGLDFQFMHLHNVPASVFYSTGIKRVDLSHNPLMRVPACLSLPVHHITTLIMRYCEISELDASIRYFNNLEFLDLEGNYILTIPNELMILSGLRRLNLNNNRIRDLPQTIGNLKQLTELNIDNNELQTLHEALEKCTNLRILSAERNKLHCLQSFLFNIPSLRDLRLCRNLIKIIPEGIGKLALVKLSISFNNIELLEDFCFCPLLNSTLEILEFNGNRIRVLPHSFGKLSKLVCMNLDMNLLESPPMALLNEGIETIVKYCTARAKIVLGLSKKLISSGFKIEATHFAPPVSNLIIEGRGFLTANDLREFDEIVDRSVNGEFFSDPQSIEKICKHIKDLRTVREHECHEQLVGTMIDMIRKEYVLREGSEERELSFRSDIERSFSMLEGKVKCFALPLNQIVLPNSGSEHAEFSSSIFVKVKKELRSLDILYNFQDSDLFKALKYKSPFGPVSTIQRLQYDQNGGIEQCEKVSLVIRQTIYSNEEAERKCSEEDLLKAYYEKMVKFIDHWSTQKCGIRSINAEVLRRQHKLVANMFEAKKALQKYQSKFIKELKKKSQKSSRPKAEKLENIVHVETQSTIESDIKVLKEQYKEAKALKLEMHKNNLSIAVLEDLRKKSFYAIFERVTRNSRAFAMINNLRRPWDARFHNYKAECRGLKESKIVLNKNDLVKKLDRIVSCAQCNFERMELMSKYDNEPYDKFQRSSLLTVLKTKGKQ